jgi:hypothetical protein
MEHDKTIRSFGLKIITITAIAILIFSTYTILISENEGESKALMSVDDANEFKIVRRNSAIIHNITIQNVGGQPLIVLLSSEVFSVSAPGQLANWSVRFLDGGTEITNVSVALGETKTIGVEVSAGQGTKLHETAKTRITGKDAYLPLSGPTNTTKTTQNAILGTELILTTRVGQSYDPHVEIASGTENMLYVNPNTETTFRVKVSNWGLELDSVRLIANVGAGVRGETRASESWRVTFAPSSLVQDLNSINDGIGYSAIVYINVTAPNTAVYGNYPITITAASQFGNEEDTTELIARVRLPDLYVKSEDISFSRFPVIDGQSMIINVTVHNNGGAVTEDIELEFWAEDTIKDDNYGIIGVASISYLGNQDEAYATIVFVPELHPSIKETLTTTGIRVNVDPLDEVIESDELNNQAYSNLEILKAPKTTSSYTASLFMMVGMIAVAALLATGERLKHKRK